MKRKFASLFLVLALVLTMIPASAFADTGMENNTFTIDQADATYEIGEPIMVTANSDVEGAWIGLYQADDDTSVANSYWWYYVNGSYGGKSWTNGETYNLYNTVCENGRGGYSDYRGLVEAGKYKLVLFYGDQSVSKEIEITNPTDTTTSVEVEKDTYTVGETVKVKSNAYAWGDWVGIYKTTYTDLASVPSSGYEDYHYAVGHNGLWFEYSSLAAGEYTAVLWSNEGETATAMDTFVVEAGESGETPDVPTEVVFTDKASYEYGQDINVTTNYKQTEKDWVGIFKKGTYPTGTAIAYYYIGTNPETININTTDTTDIPTLVVENESYYYEGKLLAGDYTIAVVANDQTAVSGAGVGSTDITITGGPDPYEAYSITVNPEQTLEEPIIEPALPGLEFYDLYTQGFEKGLNITVSAPEGADESMWVGLYDAIDTNNSTCLAYQYVDGKTGVEFDFADGWTIGTTNTTSAEQKYGYRKLVFFTSESGAVADTKYIYVRQNASDWPVNLSATEFVYNGAHQAPVVDSVTNAGSNHWTATVPTNTVNAGTYEVVVDFFNKLGGQAIATYKILPKDVADLTVTGISDVTANGSAFKPVPTVTYNGMTLVEGTDYDVAYGENTKPGKGTVTITGKGNYTGTKTVEFNIIEKVCNHVWDDGKMTTPDTCTTVGVKTYTCTLDSTHTKTENVDVIKDHAWDAGKMTTADTCTAVGVKTFTCANDATHTKTENVDVIKDHAWDAGKVTKAATCKAEGVKTFTCANDATHTKTEKIAIDANAHSFGEFKVTKEATCKQAGQKVSVCTICNNAQKSETVPATGVHTEFTVAGKAATCTETGLTDGKKCSVCGDTIVAQQTIPAKGHKEVSVAGKDATCTEAGLTAGKQCSVCKAWIVKQTETAPLGHEEVSVAGKAATCTKTGLTAGKKCSVCGVVTVKQEVIAMTAHKKATTVVTKKANLTKAGKMVDKCKCGKILKTTTIAKASKISIKKSVFTYTGKAINPTIIVKDSNNKVIAKSNYTITKSKKTIKEVGKYTVTVKFKNVKGAKYTGTKKFTVEVQPAKVTVKKPVAAKKAITVKWAKGKKAAVTGYEVMYSTNKNFKKGKATKTKVVKGYSKTSLKITKLTAKKTYYVKVRAYKTVKVNGKNTNIYSAWSAPKNIKTR